ncbi:MAG: hypothetical protein ABSA50_06175 [Candidatus Bathyarchaeia archaeon]
MLKTQHADAMIMVLTSYEWVAVLIIIVVIALAYLFWRSFSRRMEGTQRPQTTTGAGWNSRIRSNQTQDIKSKIS